ncbi:hypothetical protein GH714_018823 [Hevea brasiliensis]|uniref:Protein kinase domain-containing protein n=1 Tax=Hevea brasiliensis TaxID=3981 RepID=A0A6A6LL31_HEVBR|nr:hypothetical protein GH714_018823 [Hevea brasiliensis]
MRQVPVLHLPGEDGCFERAYPLLLVVSCGCCKPLKREPMLVSKACALSWNYERFIVYDYMLKHSLITHLRDQLASDCMLDCTRRMTIAIGSAEEQAYLHHKANPHLIYRDIRGRDVLLDEELQACTVTSGLIAAFHRGFWLPEILCLSGQHGTFKTCSQWCFVLLKEFNMAADFRLNGI